MTDTKVISLCNGVECKSGLCKCGGASMSTSATGSGIGGGGWGPGDIEKGRKESRFEQSPNDVDEFPDVSESRRPGITGELW